MLHSKRFAIFVSPLLQVKMIRAKIEKSMQGDDSYIQCILGKGTESVNLRKSFVD